MWGSLLFNYQSIAATSLAVLNEQCMGRSSDLAERGLGKLGPFSYWLVHGVHAGLYWNDSESQ